MLRVVLSRSALPMGGLYDWVVTSGWGIGTSHGDISQMDLEIPGGGGTIADIPPKEVLRVVTPLEEAVVL